MKYVLAIVGPPAVAAMVLLAGCTTQPSVAERMRGHADDQQLEVDLKNLLAQDWEQGTRLVRSGQKRVEAGNRLIETARSDLEKGRQQVEQGQLEIGSGRKLVQESEARFRATFPDAELLPAKN